MSSGWLRHRITAGWAWGLGLALRLELKLGMGLTIKKGLRLGLRYQVGRELARAVVRIDVRFTKASYFCASIEGDWLVYAPFGRQHSHPIRCGIKGNAPNHECVTRNHTKI